MSVHPVLDVGARVRVLADTQGWDLDFDTLDVDAFLAGSDQTDGAWTDLSADLIEVTWSSGSRADDNPDEVLPLPESGTCELSVWDPTLAYQPPANTLYAGIRPGRALQLYDRADGTALWTGVLEQVAADWSNPVPLTVLRGVQTVTALANHPGLPADLRPAEPVYDRFVALLDLYLPGVPARADPAALTAVIAGTQVDSSPWEALRDCGRAQPGWLSVHRDGGIALNTAEDLDPVWDGRWTYHTSATGPGRARVFYTPGVSFRVLFTPPPQTGTGPAGPPAIGQRIVVGTGEVYLIGTVTGILGSDPLDVECALTLDGGWVEPGTNTSVRLAEYPPAGSRPAEQPVWVQPPCAAVTLRTGGSDLQRLRNVWRLRRRFTDGPDATAEQAESVAAFGRWTTENLDYPSGSDSDLARIAGLGAQLWGEGRPATGSLVVNVTAAQHTAELPTLIELVRTVNVGAPISIHLPGSVLQERSVRVLGWQWTWTAAGGLHGDVSLTRGLGTDVAAGWQMGIYLHSTLEESTVLT